MCPSDEAGRHETLPMVRRPCDDYQAVFQERHRLQATMQEGELRSHSGDIRDEERCYNCMECEGHIMNVLKTCPFCGAEAVYELSVSAVGIETIRAGCPLCRIFTEWAMNRDKITERWNARPECYPLITPSQFKEMPF